MNRFRFPAPSGGRLTPVMVDAFRNLGFLVLEDFAAPEAIAHLRRRALELMRSAEAEPDRTVFSTTSRDHNADRYFMESGDKIRFFWEEGAVRADGSLSDVPERCLNKIGHALHDLDPEFERFSYRKEIAEIARTLGHARPAIIQSMYILKPPRIGGEVTCHQDSTYIYTEPDTCLGFWFALEDATLENGCMQFLPGLHARPLRERNVRTGPLTTELRVFDDRPWPLDEAVPVEAPAGSVAIFHGRAPHFSGPNASEKSRHAYTLHLIDQEARYPDDNWLQRGADMPLRDL